MTRLTPERQAVVELLRGAGEMTPAEITAALGRSAGSTRKLLSSMAEDSQIRTQSRGRYTLPSASVTDVTENVTDVTDDVTGVEESPVPTLNRSVTAPQIFAWSEADGGMISNAELRKRKGYRD